jgi:hypothetical protein
LLHIVRWIIVFGKDFAAALQQRAATADFRHIAHRYRTSDIKLILARITRGLMLAGALEAKLAERVAHGRDEPNAPARPPAPRAPRDGAASGCRAPRRTNIIDLPLDRLPTAEEIASELRRRPIGAIIADICRDIGIMPGDMDGEQWQELSQAMMFNGGNLVVLVYRESKGWRLTGSAADAVSAAPARQEPTPPATTAACPTGPPAHERLPLAAQS